jgi:hypothetical protein
MTRRNPAATSRALKRRTQWQTAPDQLTRPIREGNALHRPIVIAANECAIGALRRPTLLAVQRVG